LKQEGFDVYVANVSAYSTLGWFDDPVLNTFIDWPDYRLAGMIFHELAHQHVYVKGDSSFNESFAMAVQQLGVEKWLEANGEMEHLQKYRQHIHHRERVISLIEQAREELKQLYAKNMDDDQKRVEKQQLLQALKQRYLEMTKSFEVSDGFKRWFETDLNNAKLVSVSTYNSQVPIFKNIMQYHQQDFKEFLSNVKMIASLDVAQRNQCLDLWLGYDSNKTRTAERTDDRYSSCKV
jgi:predicted aminopeptidase